MNVITHGKFAQLTHLSQVYFSFMSCQFLVKSVLNRERAFLPLAFLPKTLGTLVLFPSVVLSSFSIQF